MGLKPRNDAVLMIHVLAGEIDATVSHLVILHADGTRLVPNEVCHVQAALSFNQTFQCHSIGWWWARGASALRVHDGVQVAHEVFEAVRAQHGVLHKV